jgi:hypothetical protein
MTVRGRVRLYGPVQGKRIWTSDERRTRRPTTQSKVLLFYTEQALKRGDIAVVGWGRGYCFSGLLKLRAVVVQ